MKQSALKYALWLLERRDYSTREIFDKLERKEYSKEEIAESMKRLSDLKFLDDDRFTKRFIEREQLKGNVGRRLISLKLTKKGIDKELIGKYMSPADPELITETALKWLKKQQKRPKANTRGRLFAYLAGRGFDYDEIKKIADNESVKELIIDRID